DDVNTSKKELEVKPTPKPKVYKFFKSRAPSESSEPLENKSSTTNTSPKPLMLNSFSKQDGVKRITATIGKGSGSYGKNKSERNATFYQSGVSNLPEQKSREIKVCGDKTIKKVISPTKTTQF